jgi:hypothetical protein
MVDGQAVMAWHRGDDLYIFFCQHAPPKAHQSLSHYMTRGYRIEYVGSHVVRVNTVDHGRCSVDEVKRILWSHIAKPVSRDHIILDRTKHILGEQFVNFQVVLGAHDLPAWMTEST